MNELSTKNKNKLTSRLHLNNIKKR